MSLYEKSLFSIFLPLIVAKYTSAETVQPFHSPEESVNSQFYLPPPPGNDDPAFRYDKEAYFKGYAIKGSPRWKQAAEDADVSVENIARIFSPVVGAKINPKDTPETWNMLKNLLTMGGYYATASAKNIICVLVPLSYLIIPPAVLKMRILCEKMALTLPGILLMVHFWH